ncbi:hypothetical protein CRG98_041286 [Punica granatum]|uniref:Retrotransposon gag domain-containing protein n=1 Tax=Punica granatum TaxID=22663 RepID=A0A2I0I2X7_PUNGR|nr:hypothetical protein CRG98_041286 [Punica granatum]
MKRLMHRRFMHEYYKQQLYLQLQSIRQCSMSVEDYVKEFKLLTMGCELHESRETTIAHFLGGLNKGITDMIERQPFVYLEDVIKLAIKVRRQQKHGQLTTLRGFNMKPVIVGFTPQGSASRWNEPQKEVEGSLKSQTKSTKVKEQEVDPQSPVHEVEEAVEDVCGVTSKEKVEYADEDEKLKAQQVVSSESKLEEQRECLENIPKGKTSTLAAGKPYRSPLECQIHAAREAAEDQNCQVTARERR